MSVAVFSRTALLLVLLPSLAVAQARVERNIVYGMYSGTALLMDVYYPAAPNGLGVVFVPGSGWASEPEYAAVALKDQEQPAIWVPPLTARGYTVFVPNHRATPGFRYPAPLEDVRRAVRFVRYHATTYRVDPNRLGGMGGSSGGHLMAMTGTLDDGAAPDDLDPVDRQSARVQALVLRAAATDLTKMLRTPSLAALFGTRLPTATSSRAAAIWKSLTAASPLMHVSSDDPPSLLIHGDADADIDYQQSGAFAAALHKVGAASRLVSIPGGSHGPTFMPAGTPLDAPRPANWPDYFAETVGWFDRHLKDNPLSSPRTAR
jgi:acetyl esterase/lipase